MSWNSGMAEIVSNTSPLLYLYRIQVLDWLPVLGGEVWLENTGMWMSDAIRNRVLALAGEVRARKSRGT